MSLVCAYLGSDFAAIACDKSARVGYGRLEW